MINIISSSRYHIDKPFLRLEVNKMVKKLEIDEAFTINLVFIGKIKMKAISTKYKHENVALPVLAFPYKTDGEIGEKLLGEIIICYPQAVLLSAERNRRVNDTLVWLIEHAITNLLK